MALVRYTQASGVSGSVAGTTYSRNAYGAYMRSRVTPTNPRTDAQEVVRGIFGAASAAWRALTDAQRIAWASLAEVYSWSNALGEAGKLKANALYQSFHGVVGLTDTVITDDKPSTATITAPDFTVTASEAEGSVKVNWSAATKAWLVGTTTGRTALVYVSSQTRPTRLSDLPKTLRHVMNQKAIATPGPTSTEYFPTEILTGGNIVRVTVLLVQVDATGLARSVYRTVDAQVGV